MKYLYYLFFSLILFPTFLFSQVSEINDLISKSIESNSPIILEKDKKYFIESPLKINKSIIGNNATIIPLMDNPISVSFISDSIKISDLNIKDGSMIDIAANSIIFENCKFKTKKYFVLLRLGGDNISFNNSELINEFGDQKSFVIKNKEGVSIRNLSVSNSKLFGGISIANYLNEKIGNYIFINNNISVDYSKLNQDIRNQNDAFHFEGIDGIIIKSNKINLLNVTRGFKMTNFNLKYNSENIFNPTTNVILENNDIVSNALNGKQLFDFYNGTTKVDIINNNIDAVGHTTIFEDKTVMTKYNIAKRNYLFKGNTIQFDFKLAYIRGADNLSELKEEVNVEFLDNNFIYKGNQNKSLDRLGSESLIDNKYLIYLRAIKDGIFKNNTFYDDKNFLSTLYNFFINDVKSIKISNNSLYGTILIQGANNSGTISNNKILGLRKKYFVEFLNPFDKNNFKIDDNDMVYPNKNSQMSNL